MSLKSSKPKRTDTSDDRSDLRWYSSASERVIVHYYTVCVTDDVVMNELRSDSPFAYLVIVNGTP